MEELIELLDSLHGNYEFLLPFNNLIPTVFLIDEDHSNINNSIQLNIENAISLINNSNVILIGVESLAGGMSWNKTTGEFDVDSLDDKEYLKHRNNYRNDCVIFMEGLLEFEDLLTGVENIDIFDTIHVDVSFGRFPDVESHPLNIKRSKHFIQTLIVEYINRNQGGNMILNCGRDHNNHFANWIHNQEINQIVGEDLNYVRISTL